MTVDTFTPDALQRHYDAGWVVADTFWGIGGRGAFAIEQRGTWAGVTLLVAQPDAWDDTLHASTAQARALGAKEIYFTIDAGEARRRAMLERRGFREVDAGAYYLRDAD